MHLVNSLLDALLFCLLNALRLFAGATTFLIDYSEYMKAYMNIMSVNFEYRLYIVSTLIV